MKTLPRRTFASTRHAVSRYKLSLFHLRPWKLLPYLHR